MPNLQAVYDMTWREFHLRKAGFERSELRKWERAREIAYWSGAGTAFDWSKTSVTKFMPLSKDESKPKVSEAQRERFKEAMNEYKKNVNGS